MTSHTNERHVTISDAATLHKTKLLARRQHNCTSIGCVMAVQAKFDVQVGMQCTRKHARHHATAIATHALTVKQHLNKDWSPPQNCWGAGAATLACDSAQTISLRKSHDGSSVDAASCPSPCFTFVTTAALSSRPYNRAHSPVAHDITHAQAARHHQVMQPHCIEQLHALRCTMQHV